MTLPPNQLQKCGCPHCGGDVEYEVQWAESPIPCPICKTEFVLPPAAEMFEQSVPLETKAYVPNRGRFKKWLPTIIMVVGGLGAIFGIGYLISCMPRFLWTEIILPILGLCGAFMLAIFIYMYPTILASRLNHANTSAIRMLNFFLGWTFLGWVGALIWAELGRKKRK